MRMLLSSSALLIATLSGGAFAQTTAGTDLNLHSGPGVQYPVIGVIPESFAISVDACIEGGTWCQISSGDNSGWVFRDVAPVPAPVTIVEPPAPAPVTVVEAPVTVIETQSQDAPTGQDTAVAGTTGAVIGALLAGPVGAVAGAAIGGAAGASAEPDPAVRTYITTQTVEPVTLEGDLVIGAGVPDVVPLYEVSEYPDYRHARINGRDVLIDPETRQIIYIYE